MAVVKVPRSFPPDVVDISATNPTPLDNGKTAIAEAIRSVEEALVYLAAGIVMALGGWGRNIAFTSSPATFETHVARHAYALDVEACVRISVTDGAAADYVDVKFATDYDSTGETIRVHIQQSSDGDDAQNIVLRAGFGDGTSGTKGADIALTLTFTESSGSTSTTRVWCASFRTVPQEEITI